MATRGQRRFVYLPSAVLICLEAASLLAAFLLGAAITVTGLSIEGILVAAMVYAAASLASMSVLRLYTARRSSLPGLMLRVGLALGMTAFICFRLYDLVPRLATAGAILPAAAVVTFVTVLAIRIAFDCIWERQALRVVLVLGAGRRAADVARLRRRADRQGFVVLGYVATSGDRSFAITPRLRVDVCDNLLAYCRRHGVEEIVVAMDDPRHGFPLTEANKYRDAGIAITGLGAFLERETGGIRLDALKRGTSVRDVSAHRPDGYRPESMTRTD